MNQLSLTPVESPVVPKAASTLAERPSFSQRSATLSETNLSGYVPRCEGHDWAAIDALINRFYEINDAIIADSGGHVINHLADRIQAVWGFDGGVRNHAEVACDAAMRQHEAMASFNAWLTRRGLRPLRIRIGIHTGDVKGAAFALRSHLGVVGSTVKLLSDIAATAKRFEMPIVVSQTTRNHLGHGSFTALAELKALRSEPPLVVYSYDRPGFSGM